MKLHVQCDRCKKYEEALSDGTVFTTVPPKTWYTLRAFAYPVLVNRGYPEGPISVLLCPDCLPAVQRAIEAAVARRT